MGLHAATSGRAWIAGVPHEDPASRRGVGFLPERPYFYEHLSARELLRFYGQLYELEHNRRERRIDELLGRVELDRFADVPLRKYSKGMLQRVGVCQALLHEPDVVVLDEPMSGLDPLGRALVRDLILQERRAGRTVFFSSHILHDVETLSDRVAIVVGGRLRGVGTLDELLDRRVRYVECVFAGLVEADLAERPGVEGLRTEGERLVVRVAPGSIDDLLAMAHGRGATVVSVTPVRETLEDALLDEVERGRPLDRKHLGVLA